MKSEPILEYQMKVVILILKQMVKENDNKLIKNNENKKCIIRLKKKDHLDLNM